MNTTENHAYSDDLDSRDWQIYLEYLEGLTYRAKPQAEKFNLSLSRYKAILARMKKIVRNREVV